MAKKPNKILVVDDDKSFLNMITAALKSMDSRLSIDTARSGKECLQKMKSFLPNLVFLDIGMDGMNGLVTLRFIRSMDKKALVYFLSGHPVKYIKEAVGMVHVDGYFTKTQFIDLLNTKETLDEVLNDGKATPSNL